MRIEKAIKNPWVELALGLVIMSTGLIEAGDSIFADVATGDVGAHHGIALVGLAHAIKSIPAILGGIAIFAHGAERETHE